MFDGLFAFWFVCVRNGRLLVCLGVIKLIYKKDRSSVVAKFVVELQLITLCNTDLNFMTSVREI